MRQRGRTFDAWPGRIFAAGATALCCGLALARPLPAHAQAPGGDAPPPAPSTGPDYEAVRHEMLHERVATMLRPAEIETLRSMMLDGQGATACPGYPGKCMPEGRRRDIDYLMAPGRGPENLRLSQGVLTPMTFQATGGKPLAVASMAWDQTRFSINGKGCDASDKAQDGKNKEPMLLYIVPCSHTTWGSITVQVQGYAVPIVFWVSSGDNAGADYVDAPVVLTVHSTTPPPSVASPAAGRRTPRLPAGRRRPQGRVTAPQALAGVDGGPADLWSFASGTPPTGATPLASSQPDTQAWLYRGQTYVRSPDHLVGPASDALGTAGKLSVWRFDSPVREIHATSVDGRDLSITLKK